MMEMSRLIRSTLFLWWSSCMCHTVRVCRQGRVGTGSDSIGVS